MERKTENMYNVLLKSNNQAIVDKYRNPYLESSDFFEELLRIGTRKRIKLDPVRVYKPTIFKEDNPSAIE